MMLRHGALTFSPAVTVRLPIQTVFVPANTTLGSWTVTWMLLFVVLTVVWTVSFPVK